MIYSKGFSFKSVETLIILVAISLSALITTTAEGGIVKSDSNNAAVTKEKNKCDSLWPHRIKITIDSTKVEDDLVGFPIYVNLADLPADFHTNVRSDGGDIRVTAADGKTELPREVVFYNSSNNTGELHFKNTGTLSSASDTDFYIYYGNAGAVDYPVASDYGRNNVWTDYEAVYHLEDATDSSGNERTLTQQGTTAFDTTAQKLAGKYADFGAAGGNSLFRLNDNYGLIHNDPQSWSFWYKIHTLNADDSQVIFFSKAAENNGAGGYGWYVTWYSDKSNPLLYWTRMNTSADGDFLNEAITLATSTWYHTAQTFDGVSTNEGWRDGISKGTWVSSGDYSGANDQGFTLGGWWVPGTPGTLRGAMDEFRLFKGKYPAGWVKTEYNNHNSANTFYSVGSQEVQSWY